MNNLEIQSYIKKQTSKINWIKPLVKKTPKYDT